jgi:hypothetical protein
MVSARAVVAWIKSSSINESPRVAPVAAGRRSPTPGQAAQVGAEPAGGDQQRMQIAAGRRR